MALEVLSSSAWSLKKASKIQWSDSVNADCTRQYHQRHKPDGGPLTYTDSAVDPAEAGTDAIDSTGHVTFTPATHWVRTATFTYTATDGISPTTSTVTINVTDGLSASPLTLNGPAGTTLIGPVSYSNPDGSTLTITADPSANGTLTIDDAGNVTFVPNDPNWIGTETITYNVDDGIQPATVEVVSWFWQKMPFRFSGR